MTTCTRLIYERYALIRGDGQIAGDGESECIYHDRQTAEEEYSNRPPGNFKDFLEGVNGGPLRIAKVQLREVEDGDLPDNPRGLAPCSKCGKNGRNINGGCELCGDPCF
jgi:hypothetical protein